MVMCVIEHPVHSWDGIKMTVQTESSHKNKDVIEHSDEWHTLIACILRWDQSAAQQHEAIISRDQNAAQHTEQSSQRIIML